jgi:hypothetical protein
MIGRIEMPNAGGVTVAKNKKLNNKIMGRTIRKVTANWEHPKKSDGRYQPMHEIYYGDALSEWIKEHLQWEDGTHPDIVENPARKQEYPFYALWGGNPPDVEYYQTRKYTEEELTHIQLYEDTSEGTPISPVFPKEDFEKLCEWLANNKASVFGSATASKEEWMKMLANNNVYHREGNITFI